MYCSMISTVNLTCNANVIFNKKMFHIDDLNRFHALTCYIFLKVTELKMTKLICCSAVQFGSWCDFLNLTYSFLGIQ